jgi:hypothetical protein
MSWSDVGSAVIFLYPTFIFKKNVQTKILNKNNFQLSILEFFFRIKNSLFCSVLFVFDVQNL